MVADEETLQAVAKAIPESGQRSAAGIQLTALLRATPCVASMASSSASRGSDTENQVNIQ